jgi:hypothetical protein
MKMDDIVMGGFFDEMEKIGVLTPLKKGLGLIGAGTLLGAGGLHAGRKALKRYRIGKAMQEHQEAMRERAEAGRQ